MPQSPIYTEYIILALLTSDFPSTALHLIALFDLDMASSSYRIRRLTTNRQKTFAENDNFFSVNRSPVTPRKRDASQFEDYRQRVLIERMRDAFRTISFRSEPTIGEEHLVRESDSRRSRECKGQTPNTNGYPTMNKKGEELVQNLVPECYEHIQNFHHYRSDMARLNSGFKVVYLSGNEMKGNSEKELRRVYRQKSRSPTSSAFLKGHFQILPGSKIRSTRKANMVSKKAVAASEICRHKGTGNAVGNSQVNVNYSRGRVSGNDPQRTVANPTETSLNIQDKQRLRSQLDQSELNVNNASEMPHFKLEKAPANPVESQPSSHSLASDISGRKPPMTTPDGMSRRSSVRTLVFEGEVLDSRKADCISSLQNTPPRDSNHTHYLVPFYSRFPHLKVRPNSSSCPARKRRNGEVTIPSWQQYRILCDAFRPDISPERVLYQKNYLNGYKRPKFATTTELEYYINVVCGADSNSALHLS